MEQRCIVQRERDAEGMTESLSSSQGHTVVFCRLVAVTKHPKDMGQIRKTKRAEFGSESCQMQRLVGGVMSSDRLFEMVAGLSQLPEMKQAATACETCARKHHRTA